MPPAVLPKAGVGGHDLGPTEAGDGSRVPPSGVAEESALFAAAAFLPVPSDALRVLHDLGQGEVRGLSFGLETLAGGEVPEEDLSLLASLLWENVRITAQGYTLDPACDLPV